MARFTRALLLTTGFAAGPARPQTLPDEVRFAFPDGVELVADIHVGPQGREGPVILLFHQGGGNARGEYRSITPRLIQNGYSVIAFDIRGGGDRFDATSRVATGSDFRYCDALRDVEGALDLAHQQGFAGPLVLWGSSYSAALVMQTGARRAASVAAVLAFSPASGEPMAGCEPVRFADGLVRAGKPTLVLRPRTEAALPAVAEQLRLLDDAGIATFVAESGTHGSSMLDAERVVGDVSPQWDRVLDFLRTSIRPMPSHPLDRRASPASALSLPCC